MSNLRDKQVLFKIAPPESLYIIGSNSIDTFGDLFTVNVNAINLPSNKRNKRLFDLLCSFFLLMTLPLHLVLQKHRWGFVKNLFRVLSGRMSWVGYHHAPGVDKLPPLKESVLHPGDAIRASGLKPDTINNLNNLYAKDYKVENDLQLCLKAYRELGRSTR